jgi:hypothetical protein
MSTPTIADFRYSSKRTAELEVFGVNVGQVVPDDDTITGASVEIFVKQGKNTNPLVALDFPTYSGTRVQQRFSGGTAETIYLIRWNITTNTGIFVQPIGELRVRA